MTEIYLKIITALIIFLLGASTFSFVNVLVYRIPLGMPLGNGRSICPKCKHVLKAYDLIPILSWLFLGAKCRYCKDKISVRYPAVELLGGGVALCTVWRFCKPGVELAYNIGQIVLMFFLFAILAAICFIDIDTLKIPNRLIAAIIFCGIVSIFLMSDITLLERGIGVLSISVPMLLLAVLIPGAFGGGDIKLMAALGLFLGWKLCIVAFAIAVLTGGGYGIYLLEAKKKARKGHFAFGPFLCVGAMLALFFGNEVIRWYFGVL